MSRGIKETREVMAFITTLGVLVGQEVAGDGLQITDLIKLFGSDKFKNTLTEAFDGFTVVTAELKDLSVTEGFDLSLAAIESFREILAAFEKAAA